MFQYEDLMWLISFPLVCAVMLWFSLDLAVLVRVGGGRRRRANARRAIERLILNSPVCGTTAATPTVAATAHGVVQSLSSLASPTTVPGRSAFPYSQQPSPQHQQHHSTYNGQQQQHKNDSSASTEEDDSFARQPGMSPPSPHNAGLHAPYAKVRQVAVPAALRIATRAVVRRAVVLVGGDFARSPRMQYHAASLARSGLFDEILLVGLDCGNQLSEELLISGEPQPERFVTREGAVKGVEQAVYDVEERLSSPVVHAGHGCIISTRYLARPPTPPEWFQTVFPLRSLHWVVCTLYRVIALSVRFIVQCGRVTATRINEHGQLLVTDLILVQTPPAVPFVLLVKYFVCPLAFVYNVLLYYCVVVPAAWMNPDAMRDMRRECRLQSLRFQPKARTTAAEAARNGTTTNTNASSTSEAGKDKNNSHAVPVPKCAQRIRPWVFYPALVVDWHNYGYTILEQNQRPTTAVQLYKFFEVHLCAGSVNVTVSRAMRDSLERFYPWLRPRATTVVESPVSSLASLSSTLVNGHRNHHTYQNSESGRAGNASTTATSARTVTVLYDVAPSFFRPVSRRRCVREVLDRLLRRNSTSPNTAAAPTSTYNHNNSNSSNNNTNATSGPYALVSMSELESLGWGIAGPPAWVYAEAASEAAASAASPPGSPSTLGPPSTAFGPPATPRRGVVVVGSTSWTEEDDYSVLLRALRRLDHRLNHEVQNNFCSNNSNNNSNNNNTNHNCTSFDNCGGAGPLEMWVLITGKGPARKRFEDAVRAAKLSSHVVVSTYYAQSFQEYSVLLGAADVGFCLHFSSSGLDLPMKAVDMVGAGLPVIALQYPAISELMGGPTRVLAQSRAIAPSSKKSSSEPAALVECERGWVFRGDIDLEVLLSSFVGLPASEPAGSWMSNAMARGGGGGSGSAGGLAANSALPLVATTTQAPTPLPVMKRKAQEARLHASTWSENWTRVLLPVLKEVV